MKKILISFLLITRFAALAQTDYYAKTLRFASGIDTTTTRANGTLFFNHTSNKLRVWVGGSKYTVYPAVGGGSSTLAALTDVSLTGLATNDFLKYDGADWINRTPSNVRTDLSLVPGTDVQAYDADLASWAGVTRASGFDSFTGNPSWTNFNSMITGTAPYWSLASGGTFTAANTLAMAGFNANFLNGNILSGPTGATITASTRFDLRGTGTTTGLIQRWADNANTLRGSILDNGTTTFISDAGSTPFRFQTSTATNYVGFSPGSTSGVVFGNPSGTITLGIHSTASDYLYTNAVSGIRMTRLTLSNASGNDTNAPFIRRSGTNGTGQLQINAGDGAGPNEIRIKFQSDFTGITSGATTLVGVDQTFTQSSGTHSLNCISLTPTINTTGTYSGFGSGYYWNPTLTSTTGFTNYAFRSSSGLWGVNTSTPNNSAQLEISSTTRGFLPPRMTGTQAEAISSPAEGLMVYSTDGSGSTITSKGWWGYDGSTWLKLN